MTSKSEEAVSKALELVPVENISTMVERLSKDDLGHQTNAYHHIVEVEATDAANQLRHRAAMMRQRADEFDTIADNMEKTAETVVKQAYSFENNHRQALELLQAHAHINPTKVTNGGSP